MEVDEVDEVEIEVFEELVVIDEVIVDVTEVESVDVLVVDVEMIELDEPLDEVDCGELVKLELVEE